MLRKILSIIILSTVVLTTVARDSYEYRYWFDYNDSNGVFTGTSSTAQWNMIVDARHVSPTLHTLHIQVKDEAGYWGEVVTKYFIKPNTIYSTLCYQVDNGKVKSLPITNSAIIDIDASLLNDGIHQLCGYVVSSEGIMSIPFSRYFFKIGQIEDIMCNIYIDDILYDTIKVNNNLIDLEIDMESLSVGIHNLTIHTRTSNKELLNTYSNLFYREAKISEMAASRCYYAIDGGIDTTNVQSLKDGGFIFDIDVSKCNTGLHTFYANIVNNNEETIHTYTSCFYRSAPLTDISSAKCYYRIDNMGNGFIEAEGKNGVFDFDVDATQLDRGLQKITYFVKEANGICTPLQVAFFFKHEKTGIRLYQYWLNDDYENREIVKLDRPQDPFSLIRLLEVDAVPVRTEMFHFEESDGIPTVYAKNTINLNFYTDEQMVSHSSDYIDYSVYEVIDSIVDISFLKSHTQTIPAHNKINWYKFYTLQDDTVSLYTNRACRLQLFDAAGNVLYSAEGDSAMIGSDVCIPYSANYYVALYEVSDEENDITLNYRHKKIATVQGDANGDGRVSVADIVVIGNYIMGVENEQFVVEAADVNGDGRVSVTDIVKVGNLIMDSTYPTKSLLRKALMNIDGYGLSTLSVDEAMCDDANTRQLNIYVNNDEAFTAMQMDIIMPNGAVVTDAKLSDRATSDHTILLNNKRTDATRIMSYSLSNDNFTGKHGKVVTLTVETDDEFDGGEIVIDNIILAQDNGKEQLVRPISYQMSRPSDVEQLRNEGNITIEVEKRDIVITVNSDCVACISYMDGKSINVELTAGRNAIATPGSGVYIVNVKDTVEKVIVK